jgi:phosphate/sulfate permease
MDDLTLVAVVAVALFFDFTNGFHDAANAIATSVSTRAISPRLAVLGAAVLNFAGAFISIEVAATVAKGIVDAGRDHDRGGARRRRRSDHVEPDHLVPGPADQL